MIALLLLTLALGDPQADGNERPASTQGREITDPVWEPFVRSENPLRFYPEDAQKRGIEGKAIVRCVVEATGALRDCVVVNETPPGLGFGEAAIRMSVLFRMKPLTRSGERSEGGTVNLPIAFRLPK